MTCLHAWRGAVSAPGVAIATVDEGMLQQHDTIRRPHPYSTLLDAVIAFAAVGGMTLSVLYDLPVRSSAFAGSDMKTLFASVWCFAHGLNAYTFANVQSVFAAQHVIFPASWFGHAPVYPPTTLASLLPLSALPMVAAVYAVVIGSAVLFAIAVTVLMRQAARDGCGLGWRVGIAVACACCPLLGFGLSMGNVSIAAAALCIVAFVQRGRGSSWFYGALLALAVCLKPHLAIWMLTGMLLLPERAARAVAARASAIVAGFGVLVVGALAASRHLGLEAHGFTAILQGEMAAGSSMSPGSREVLPICAQITSLHSLLGFWWQSSSAQTATVICLLAVLGSFVAWRLHAARLQRDALPAIGAWVAFGLLATYHRAHDAVVLLVLLPWIAETMRRSLRAWQTWALILLFCGLNLAASFDVIGPRLAAGEYGPLASFVLLRQAALANLGFLLVLLLRGWHSGVAEARALERSRKAPTLHAYSAS